MNIEASGLKNLKPNEATKLLFISTCISGLPRSRYLSRHATLPPTNGEERCVARQITATWETTASQARTKKNFLYILEPAALNLSVNTNTLL